ncbi:cation transporter [Rhodovastum atsumiense]|uniref:Cation transporter n=1 Tax=Rhodovastum atsumiense TaxID=504468 RepID=A0A5M6IZQ1_9PROT|nr:cation transporter [Rhodovastum atsumiense]KAA5613783.1 cation transporter [Rhodovastum atsumiense]
MSLPAEDLAALLAARRYITIAHHIPGRIRLRFDPLPLSRAMGGRTERLRPLLGRIRGIAGIDLNLPARSLVVAYDPAVLAPATWERLLTLAAGEAAGLLDRLQAAEPGTAI